MPHNRPPIRYVDFYKVTSTMRFEWGPQSATRLNFSGDVAVTLDSYHRDGQTAVLTYTIPPASAEQSARPSKVFGIVSPSAPTADDTPESFVGKSTLVGAADVPADATTAAEIVVNVPDVPAGAYLIVTVLGFEDAVADA